MRSRKADGPLVVEVPRPGQDKPAWKRAAGIALAAFAVGLAWPRLAGIRPAPGPAEAPSASVAAPPAAAPGPAVSSLAVPAPLVPSVAASVATAPLPPPSAVPAMPSAAPEPVAVAPPAPEPPTAPAAAPPKIEIQPGAILSCKADDGTLVKGPDCGKLRGLDALVVQKLHKLAECPEAATAKGRLQLVLHLDFPHGWLSPDLGRTQTVASPEALLACARADFTGASLAGVTHDNARYSVVYYVAFGGGAEGGAAPATAPPAASRPSGEPPEGSAQVVWEVAIIRDVPKTGKVLARLQRGTQIRIGQAKDGWYPVKYGEGDANEGWVYRGAIGK